MISEARFFENADPILRVEDMAAALRFYVDILGFNNAPWGDEIFTNVARDQASVYLCCGAQGRGGAWVWMGVEDVRVVRAHLAAHNWPVVMEPTNFPWALEIHVEDPDGNMIRFGSEPEPE
jgi:catechol 2,3-dioxygenase-like lactoylglutathione lyase family enzyme